MLVLNLLSDLYLLYEHRMHSNVIGGLTKTLIGWEGWIALNCLDLSGFPWISGVFSFQFPMKARLPMILTNHQWRNQQGKHSSPRLQLAMMIVHGPGTMLDHGSATDLPRGHGAFTAQLGLKRCFPLVWSHLQPHRDLKGPRRVDQWTSVSQGPSWTMTLSMTKLTSIQFKSLRGSDGISYRLYQLSLSKWATQVAANARKRKRNVPKLKE